MKWFILYFLASLLATTAFAQESKTDDHFPGFKHAIFIVPQYAAVSGIRVDYERKLKNSEKWLLLAPQIYTNKNGYDQFDKFSGIGLNAYFKKFLSQSKRKNANGLARTNIYFSIGPTFQYFNMSSIEEIPEEFIEGGVTYIRFNMQDYNTKIYRVGGDSNFGMQFIFDQFSLDLYAGIGFRFALDEDGKTMDYFNEYWTDFGYSGILLTGGVRLGFLF